WGVGAGVWRQRHNQAVSDRGVRRPHHVPDLTPALSDRHLHPRRARNTAAGRGLAAHPVRLPPAPRDIPRRNFVGITRERRRVQAGRMKFTDKLGYLRYLVDKRGMKPVYMILGLTYDCNSFCRTCFNWEQLRKNKEHELSFEEIEKTFSSLGDLLFVVMSGGEPFLRRDLPDVCAMLSSQNHVKQITIPTGAIASDLIARATEETLQRCPSTQ